MYLSRLLLTGNQLHNPYEVHRELWLAFPNTPDQERDFLFRVEKRSSRQVQVLMQSRRQPMEGAKNVRLLASKAFELRLPESGLLQFLVTANPIKTITDEQGRPNRKNEAKKCRVPLINEEEQKAWLQRKLVDAALISSVEIEKQSPLNFRKEGKSGKIQPYVFKGVIQVKNTRAIEQLIQQGVGPAKAFGCGLMLVRRI